MRILIGIILCSIVWPVVGQEQGRYHVRLKDGTYLKSVSLNLDSTDLIQASLDGNLTVAFPLTEVSSISLAPELRAPARRFYHALEAGLMIGKDEISDETITNQTLQTLNGYRFWNFLQTGLGLGVDWYDNYIVMPVFLDVTVELTKSRVVPFYSGQIGYGFGWKRKNADLANVTDVKGGLTYRVEAGISVAINELSLLFSLGYRQQQTETTFGDLNQDGFEQVEKRNLNRFTITTGIQF